MFHKKRFLFFACFLLQSSISYSASSSESDIPKYLTNITPLEVLLSNIRTKYKLPADKFEINQENSRFISEEIEKAESFYRRAKYGDQEALEILREEAKTSPYACALMVKYCIKKAAAESFGVYMKTFLSFLRGKLTNLEGFEKLEDPILNLSLAVYNQLQNPILAEQYAQAVVEQGYPEGFNALSKFCANKQALAYYFKAAEVGNPRGIYRLARSCYKLDKSFIEDLYKHAAILGVPDAFFSLARKCEKMHRDEESIFYFSKLINVSPYYLLYKGQKKGWGI